MCLTFSLPYRMSPPTLSGHSTMQRQFHRQILLEMPSVARNETPAFLLENRHWEGFGVNWEKWQPSSYNHWSDKKFDSVLRLKKFLGSCCVWKIQSWKKYSRAFRAQCAIDSYKIEKENAREGKHAWHRMASWKHSTDVGHELEIFSLWWGSSFSSRLKRKAPV